MVLQILVCDKPFCLMKGVIIISINLKAVSNGFFQKICNISQKVTQLGHLLPPSLSKAQMVLQPFKSDLPDFLIGIIDALIKLDDFHVLRSDYLHYRIDQLINWEEEPRPIVWLLVDPHGKQHIISRSPHDLLPPRKPLPSRSLEVKLEKRDPHSPSPPNPKCSNFLANNIQDQRLRRLQQISVISIDQIRNNCEANLYTNPRDLQHDFRSLIAWNQAFRALSTQSFEYLSNIYEKAVALFIRKDFFKKFLEVKTNDITRLMKYEVQYKTSVTKWPIVPSSFREYEEIDMYVPTPPQRVPMINERLQSLKRPVDCGDNCVCCLKELPEGKSFCSFSLLNGWESECPNRVQKVECQHKDPEKQKICRNSEIKRHERKICAGKKQESFGRPPQIEERLTWGIDLFTRHVIYNCLPQADFIGLQKSETSYRSDFIEHSLAKAMNFMGPQGYNILQTCKYIKNHSKLGQCGETDMKEQKMVQENNNKDQNEGIFSEIDYIYADLLERNYEFAEDKTGFRIHTKGKGAICIDQRGISQGSFIVQYFGEIYEPWRWYDRQDFIKQVLKKKKLKNFIPQFYNIYLQKHLDDPSGYDILVVDPSRMGNFSSRFSHSCDPNCGTVITVSDGRYFIGMYAFRPIEYGEQLTFDYCSMTESNYEHLNAICLCGMRKCRGNYLQLSNNKIFNNLMDNSNCFYTRNSMILRSAGEVTQQDLKRCAQSNIKDGFLKDTPDWIVKWMAQVLKFMDGEAEIYKQSLIVQWRKTYPWDGSEPLQEKEGKIQLYSETSKQDLIMLRFQNLITSVDKLKYFFSRNENNKQPPIFLQKMPKITEVLITMPDSVFLQLQECFINKKCENLATNMQSFLQAINNQQSLQDKFFLFRLCCLVISHKLLLLGAIDFNNELMSDITYFYAFTHTYFSPNQYKTFQADEIVIGMSDILGEKGHANERKERSKKKYSSPFVWGQVVSWFKQTIVCPEASLSQDRRGTLSYPLIKSILRSEYPYQKQTRDHFHKVVLQKPANSWPPSTGCDLSFKNPHKLYGSIFFQSVHSREKLAGKLPKQGLLQSAMGVVNSSFKDKLNLFMAVESQLYEGHSRDHLYKILQGMVDMQSIALPVYRKSLGQPRKKVKREEEDSL